MRSFELHEGSAAIVLTDENDTMNVLFLAINLGGGGAERVLVNLANGMVNDGYGVTVRVLADIKTGSNREQLSPKVNYEYVFRKSFRGMNYLHLLPHRWIYNKIAYGHFDVIVVYLHGVLTKIVGYAPKMQKTVAYLHANMERSPFMKSFKSRRAIEKCFSGYSRIVSVSEDVQRSFINASGIDDRRLTVIYNTFDVPGILKRSKEPVAVNRHQFNLCSVGKLEGCKGYQRLTKIVKRLCDEDFDVHLTLVGDGPERKEIEAFIEANRLSDRICLVGFDSNPYKYIAASDLFVCSSFTEGFSSVVAESLILGVPVITTDCAGMQEMLGKNEYGIITENSEEALYDGLKRLLAEPETLSHYKKKAQARAAFFSPEQTVGAVEQMLEEVVKE